MADDGSVFRPVGNEITCHFKDLVGVAHGSDDGDLFSHQGEKVDGHWLLVYGHDTQRGAFLGRCQRGVDDRGCPGRVELNVGARPPREHRLPLTVQLDETAGDVFVSGVDHGIGSDLECFVEAYRDQVGHRHMADTQGFEGQVSPETL